MQVKRIIPCLDVCEGRVVKGVNFENLRDAGDPVELAVYYDRAGADELIFLDIKATSEGRQTMVDVVAKTVQIAIPWPLVEASATSRGAPILKAGAAKVVISSAAVMIRHCLPPQPKNSVANGLSRRSMPRREAAGFWRGLY